MTMATGADHSDGKAPGRLGRTLVALFMKHATVTAIDDVAAGFRLVTLEGAALRGIAWVPGQKVQIAMGSAFVARTYTPIEWDATAGRTRFLGYGHGAGPGSGWLAGLKVGDECDLFGPRTSLVTHQLIGRLALFGDETSMGLGYALARDDAARSVSCHFEVGNAGSGKQVLARLGIDDATLFARRDDDAHLGALEAALPALAASDASFVLTGKAGTIQRLRHELKRLGVPANRVAAKAYWAPGKAGLD